MSRNVRFIFSQTSQRPHRGAVSYINSVIEEYFARRGFSLESHYAQGHDVQSADSVMPFRHCRISQTISAKGPADLAVYDDTGLDAFVPQELVARKILVFFHGLAGGRGIWTTPVNASIHSYCANSDYLASVLRSVLALPRAGSGECLDLNPFEKVRTLRAPVWDEEAQSGDSADAALPEEIQRALDGTDVVGHSIQPSKPDIGAVCATMIHLNALAKAGGARGRYRLFLFEDDQRTIQRSLRQPHPRPEVERARVEMNNALETLGLKVEDVFIGVPWLPKRALLDLMRRSRYCLCYNKIPEAFGFYAAESILQGCPVFTNGRGNYRSLLPPGHGIDVYHTLSMDFGDLGVYRTVAQRIFDAVSSRSLAREAMRGADHVKREYTKAAFSADLETCLAALEENRRPSRIDAQDLFVTWSPLVRQWDEERARVASDYVSTTLPEHAARALREMLGQRWREIPAAHRQHAFELFHLGILTLSQDDPGALRA